MALHLYLFSNTPDRRSDEKMLGRVVCVRVCVREIYRDLHYHVSLF